MNTATEIMIDGRPVKFRASAATLRLYRAKFNRDLLVDLKVMGDVAQSGEMPQTATETIERLAWTMAKQADETVPDDIMAWLDEFSPLAIFNATPEIFKLWGLNTEQLSIAKKKSH